MHFVRGAIYIYVYIFSVIVLLFRTIPCFLKSVNICPLDFGACTSVTPPPFFDRWIRAFDFERITLKFVFFFFYFQMYASVLHSALWPIAYANVIALLILIHHEIVKIDTWVQLFFIKNSFLFP